MGSLWQTVVAYVLLALAVGYALYRAWRAVRAKSSCGCGSGGCGRTSEPERMPKIQVLTPLNVERKDED
jgi:hypothetical protein